jgi:hypothetical protein
MSSRYTGSPLGLIIEDGVQNYDVNSNKIDSLFSSYSKRGVKQSLRRSSGINSSGMLSTTPHSDDLYDTSFTNIVDKLRGIDHLEVSWGDVSYLKDIGIYPNNRLVILRRFGSPVIDDLYSVTNDNSPGNPISTIITWVPPGQDFISLRFNEAWEAAEASFTEILNSIGKDFRIGGLGDQLSRGVPGTSGGVLPLPGSTRLLQREIMKRLKLVSGEDASELPIGDPNLIKSAMRRMISSEDRNFSGFSGKFSISLTVKYEQKFIRGNDPTLVYADILNNILSMGTQPSTFYLGKSSNLDQYFKFMGELMNDPFNKMIEVVTSIISVFEEKIGDVVQGLKNAAKDAAELAKKAAANPVDAATAAAEATGELLNKSLKAITGSISDYVVKAYKIKIMGVVQALTGGPSTPWHITIGNPLRPIFCSGDMLCKGIELKLGEQLSFNDLPTYIEANITLESARDLGLQEIFAKFNSGGMRTTDGQEVSDRPESFWTNVIESSPEPGVTSSISNNESQITDEVVTQNNAGDTPNTTVPEFPNQLPEVTISVTSIPTDQQTNPDPSSDDPIVESGQNDKSTELRSTESQEMTGNTEGFSDQIQNPDNVENSGTDTEVPQDQNNTELQWNIGDLVYKSGDFFPLAGGSGSGNRWEIKILKSTEVGIYEGEAIIIESQIGDEGKIIKSSGSDLNLIKRQIKDGINSNEGVTTFNFGT